MTADTGDLEETIAAVDPADAFFFFLSAFLPVIGLGCVVVVVVFVVVVVSLFPTTAAVTAVSAPPR